MAGTLVYTFRTFPHIEKLKDQFPQVVVLGRDLPALCEVIKSSKPAFILGVAKAGTHESLFEPTAINRFNRTGVILKDGKDWLGLHIPDLDGTRFKVSENPTSSFCNYSMYHVENFLEQEHLAIPFSFVHVRGEDLGSLPEIMDGSRRRSPKPR